MVLSYHLVESGNHDVTYLKFNIALELTRLIGSISADMPVKVHSDQKLLISYLMTWCFGETEW